MISYSSAALGVGNHKLWSKRESPTDNLLEEKQQHGGRILSGGHFSFRGILA